MERMDGMNASAEILREFELFKRREDAQPHMSYAHEKLRYKIITEGRIELLDEVLQIPPDGTPGVLSKIDQGCDRRRAAGRNCICNERRLYPDL